MAGNRGNHFVGDLRKHTCTAPPKNKKPAAVIEKYLTGGYNVEAIKTQVTNGKNNMPAFGEKLGPDDIEDVASWVYDHATKWD